jgi:hypothetical protein
MIIIEVLKEIYVFGPSYTYLIFSVPVSISGNEKVDSLVIIVLT